MSSGELIQNVLCSQMVAVESMRESQGKLMRSGWALPSTLDSSDTVTWGIGGREVCARATFRPYRPGHVDAMKTFVDGPGIHGRTDALGSCGAQCRDGPYLTELNAKMLGVRLIDCVDSRAILPKNP
jgi:hypothetical protein